MKNKKEDEEVVKEIKSSKPKEIHEQMKNVYKKQFEQLRSSNSSHGKQEVEKMIFLFLCCLFFAVFLQNEIWMKKV